MSEKEQVVEVLGGLVQLIRSQSRALDALIGFLGGDGEDDEGGLLPCLFCGGDDVQIFTNAPGQYAVHCYECGASGPIADASGGAIDQWNDRYRELV